MTASPTTNVATATTALNEIASVLSLLIAALRPVDQVEPGSIAFVTKLAEHRFVDIVEDLELLVIFAPPETDL